MRSDNHSHQRETCRCPALSAGKEPGNHFPLFFWALQTVGNRGNVRTLPEYNLNQIARCLNEYGAPYNALSQEVRAATAELAALKFEVLQKVGEAVGNVQTYQL